MSAPTPLELTIDALASLYGLPADQVLGIALHNLTVLAAYQMGAEGAPTDAQRVFALLLAPALSTAQEAPSEPQEPPPTWPDPEAAAPKSREVLRAAARMTEPFTSRDLVAKYGGASASVGGILASSGWPCEAPRVGHERRWLPRPASS